MEGDTTSPDEQPTRVGVRGRSEQPTGLAFETRSTGPSRPATTQTTQNTRSSIDTTLSVHGQTGTTAPSTGTGTTSSSVGRTADSSSRGHSRTSTSVASAQDATKQGAVNSMRVLAGSMMMWCVAGVPMIAFVPGERNDKFFCALGALIVFICYAIIFVRAGAGKVESESQVSETTVGHFILVIAATLVTFGTGLGSPFIGLVAVGLLLFGMSARTREAWMIYGTAAIAHATLSTLSIFGYVDGSGMLDPAVKPQLIQALDMLWVELVYATALAVGLAVHSRNAAVLSQLEGAVRIATQREALLREVRADLDRAAGLGGAGQFTGHEFGAFRLGDVLGRGGMGEVYAAERIADGREAAVKLLRRDAFGDPGVVQRFERESQIVSKLTSPHIVEVLEIGGSEAPLPFIAMELLRGSDLATQLRNQGFMQPREVARMVRQVASGLAVAHRAGIVHRDLKPSNLFLADIGAKKAIWKVLDFGVSKQLDSDDAALTHNHIVGTPQYMAPEHASGDPKLDARADVHALAAVAYRALTGRTAFGRGEIAQVILAVTTEMPEDPRKLVELSDDVTDVLRIGFAKDPGDRFATVDDFATALTDAVDGALDPALKEHAKKLNELATWGRRRGDVAT